MRRRWLTGLRNPKTSRPSCSVQSFGLWRVVSTDQICPQIRNLCAGPLFREAPNAAETRSDLSRLADLGGCPSVALKQVGGFIRAERQRFTGAGPVIDQWFHRRQPEQDHAEGIRAEPGAAAGQGCR